MRDGVLIALDIVAPGDIAAGERLATVLSMTRYWRAERGSGPGEDAQLYTPQNFVTIIGDVRGTGASSGFWTHHRSRAETLDFGEIIDWIIAQPWSDGKVVGVGNSYAGNTADWMAERGKPALVGIVPRFPDYDPYTDLYFPGGVPNAYMGRTWGGLVKALDLNQLPGPEGAKSLGVRPVDQDRDVIQLKSAIQARSAVPSVWEGLKDITFRDDRPATWGGESMDDWGIHSHAAAVEASGTPIQTWAGWMDAGTANGALHRFMTLTNPMDVYIGAWSHGGVHGASPYRPQQAPNPSFKVQQETDLSFIDQCTGKGSTRPKGRRLNYFTMGEERWKTTHVWPPIGSKLTAFYFGPGGQLGEETPADEGFDPYAADFTTTSGKSNRWATNSGGSPVVYADRAEQDRKCLCYTTEPLKKSMEITGHALAELHLTSTHSDGAFFVYLEDVAPDGVVRYLTEGQFRAIHRHISSEHPPYWMEGPYHTFRRADAQPLIAGQIAKLAFALMPISVRLDRGHRLRIALACADADTFTRVPSRGEPVVRLRRGPSASLVRLPIMA